MYLLLLISFLLFGQSVQAETLHTVHDMDELNQLFEDSANRMQSTISVRLAKSLNGQDLRRVLSNSLCFNHIRGYSYNKHGRNDYRLLMKYMDSTRMLAAFRNPELESRLSADEAQALEVARKRIKRCVNKGMSDLEAVKALHDDLVSRVHYDKESGPECTTMMLKNRGVCDAYARCMYLMLNMLNIPCHIMVGRGRGEAHAWNLVELEPGKWYHIDATWNDPVSEKGDEMLRHTYFCLSDAEISKDHKWNRKQFPGTPKTEAFYFQKYGLYFDSYEDFWSEAQKSYEKGDSSYCAYLKCYGSKSKFTKSFQSYCKSGGRIGVLGWSAPRGKRKGPVVLSFNNKSGKHPSSDIPDPESDDILPTEKEPSWLESDIWKGIADSIDMDAMVKQSSRMLLKGINEAEKAAADFEKAEGGLQEKGKAVFEGLLKRVRE